MWTCNKCSRIFRKKSQPHSCKKIPFEKHFENKQKAKELFETLTSKIERNIGDIKIISIPCCIHLFGSYDFLAALPKKDSLEIRFALDKKIDSKRLKSCVAISKNVYKNCFEISSKEEFDNQLISWIKKSYYLKEETKTKRAK